MFWLTNKQYQVISVSAFALMHSLQVRASDEKPLALAALPMPWTVAAVSNEISQTESAVASLVKKAAAKKPLPKKDLPMWATEAPKPIKLETKQPQPTPKKPKLFLFDYRPAILPLEKIQGFMAKPLHLKSNPIKITTDTNKDVDNALLELEKIATKEARVKPKALVSAMSQTKKFVHVFEAPTPVQANQQQQKPVKDIVKAIVHQFDVNKAKQDACYGLAFDKAKATSCKDNIVQNQLGPELLVFKKAHEGGNKALAITKYQITERDYHIYCLLSGGCRNIAKADFTEPQYKKVATGLPVGLDLTDIEESVKQYNVYCALSGKCPGVFDASSKKAMTNLTVKEAKAYAKWLSKKTGQTYRLPQDGELLTAYKARHTTVCEAVMKIGYDFVGESKTSLGMILGDINGSEWVTSEDGFATRGPILASQAALKHGKCGLGYQIKTINYTDSRTAFRLVREIALNK